MRRSIPPRIRSPARSSCLPSRKAIEEFRPQIAFNMIEAFDNVATFDHNVVAYLELLRLPNFLGTPHIGGSSEEAILAMGRAAIDGLDRNAVPSADHPPEYA